METLIKTKKETVNPVDMLRLELLSSLEKYTRAMFKAQYKRSFAVNGHHKKLFQVLQDVIDGKITKVMINMPPRYSKTEVVVKSFMSYGYALNPLCRFLHLSYSDTLVNDNSSTVRNIMMEPLYKELFPNSVLEKEKGSATRWKTARGGEMYAVSTQGQVTGFGAGHVDDVDTGLEDPWSPELEEDLKKFLDSLKISTQVFDGAIIIDDPMKPEDAFSDVLRERINKRFETTIRNRVNSRRTPIIIVMQRLHEHDLCGYLLETEPDEWTVLSLPAIDIDGEGNEVPLWPMKHTLKELYRMREIDPLVFDTQYMQDPKPAEGLMYQLGFRTYNPLQLPGRGKGVHVFNYTDTADTGADDLCSINFIDTPTYIYVTNVLYTKKPMEVTEPETAMLLTMDNVDKSKVEGNNGGRGFARAVERYLRSKYKNYRTRVVTFTQTDNKYVRIFTNSAKVQNMVLMPDDWETRWPRFYKAITSYRKDNNKKSVHDDAADTLTGVVEMHESEKAKTKIKKKN